MNVDFTINECFSEAMVAQERYLVLYGGAGAGKSVFTTQKILLRTLQEHRHKFLVVRKVANTLRQSCFAEFRSAIGDAGLQSYFKINKSDMEITCINGNQIIHAGLDDVEKLKSVQGVTSVWIEEASEITPADFRQLDLRLRGKTLNYKQIVLTFNPISALSWLKGMFFDNPKNHSRVIKTTYLDNAFIDDEYSQVMEDLEYEDYVYYQVYALGNWGVLGNLIFSNWATEDFSTDEQDYEEIYQGLDFGFNNPSAWVKVGIKDGELYVLDEFCQKGLTNAALMAALEGRASKRHMLTADSAEPDRIKEFRDEGYRITACDKGKDSVSHGLDYLKRKKIHVYKDCTNLIKELQGYKYREDKDGHVHDEPVKFNDHLIDSLRYSINPLRGKGKPVKVSLDLNDSLSRESPNIF